MKKTFPLEISGKKPARVIESIKHEIRKYIARERRKPLPAGADYWDFDCRVGADNTDVKDCHVAVINKEIDTFSKEESSSIYIEILAKHGHRSKKKTN